MKYFVDFEVSREKEITQIGCVDMRGECFHTYISRCQTPIARCAREILGDTVLTPEEGFYKFFNFVNYSNEKPEFFVWGNSDDSYIYRTKKYLHTFESIFFANYLQNNLTDFHSTFCEKYNLVGCKLQDAVKTIDPTIKQVHNALEDAKLLRLIYLFADAKEVINKEINVEKRKITFSPEKI